MSKTAIELAREGLSAYEAWTVDATRFGGHNHQMKVCDDDYGTICRKLIEVENAAKAIQSDCRTSGESEWALDILNGN